MEREAALLVFLCVCCVDCRFCLRCVTLRAWPCVVGDVPASCKYCTIQNTLQPLVASQGCFIQHPLRLWAHPLCSGHNGWSWPRQQGWAISPEHNVGLPAQLCYWLAGQLVLYFEFCILRLCGCFDSCAECSERVKRTVCLQQSVGLMDLVSQFSQLQVEWGH